MRRSARMRAEQARSPPSGGSLARGRRGCHVVRSGMGRSRNGVSLTGLRFGSGPPLPAVLESSCPSGIGALPSSPALTSLAPFLVYPDRQAGHRKLSTGHGLTGPGGMAGLWGRRSGVARGRGFQSPRIGGRCPCVRQDHPQPARVSPVPRPKASVEKESCFRWFEDRGPGLHFRTPGFSPGRTFLRGNEPVEGKLTSLCLIN